MQTSLLGAQNGIVTFGQSSKLQDARIVNYLGSKQRLLGPILKSISEVTPGQARICDLFAGSGSVAVGLSSRWNVTTVDIQEYSRVLCNALLTPVPTGLMVWDETRKRAEESSLRSELRQSLAGLLNLEEEALRKAAAGNPSDLAEILELGSLFAESLRPYVPKHSLTIRQRAALDELRRRGLDAGPNTVITRYYGGVYFTWKQAIDLDSLLAQIHQTASPVRDSLLAATFGAASEAVNTIGKHFAQPIRLRDTHGGLKRHLVTQTLRDRAVSILDSFEAWQTWLAGKKRAKVKHQAIRADFQEVLADPRIEFDTVYADPPYTRDHYSRFYHILETMAVHDEPPVSTTAIRSPGTRRLSRGLYRTDRYQSPFCIKSLVEKAFKELSRLVAIRSTPMVLSYSPYGSRTGNRPRLLTVERVAEILREHFSKVNVEAIAGSAHNKFNRNERNAVVDYPAEMLLVCKP